MVNVQHYYAESLSLSDHTHTHANGSGGHYIFPFLTTLTFVTPSYLIRNAEMPVLDSF